MKVILGMMSSVQIIGTISVKFGLFIALFDDVSRPLLYYDNWTFGCSSHKTKTQISDYFKIGSDHLYNTLFLRAYNTGSGVGKKNPNYEHVINIFISQKLTRFDFVQHFGGTRKLMYQTFV